VCCDQHSTVVRDDRFVVPILGVGVQADPSESQIDDREWY
jgi:hypothetical protein